MFLSFMSQDLNFRISRYMGKFSILALTLETKSFLTTYENHIRNRNGIISIVITEALSRY